MRVLSLFLLGFTCISVEAQEIRFDTLSSRPVGPGVIHTYIEAPRLPWTINVLEVDLTESFLEIESVNAHDLLTGGYERTSSMAARRDEPGHRVVGAVNGDFFTLSAQPVGIQIVDGEILQRPAADRPVLGFDVSDHPMMEVVQLSGELIHSDTSFSINGVNTARGADHLILYNSYFGGVTNTNEFGTEVRVRALDGWVINDTLQLLVEEHVAGVGDMTIPDAMAVLSGHGAGAGFLDEYVSDGDTLEAYLSVTPGLARLKEMISGGPVLVRDGVSDVGPRRGTTDRHPRTAAGFSADSTTLYLITVDGRQASSVGATLPELAYLMTRIGVHTGMNLDGGGSTTMLVRDRIVNSPSDGIERGIANSLLVVSAAPEGGLEHIFASPDQVKVFMGRTRSFSVFGSDEYFNPVSLEESLVEFRADPEIGTINQDGVFTAGLERDSGFVFVQYGDLIDSAHVVVKTVADFDLSPTEALADTSRTVSFSIRAVDQDSLEQPVSNVLFTWTSSNEDVGVVDSTGRFRGLSPGFTEVTAAHGNVSRTAAVTVEVHAGTAQLSGFEDVESWTLTGQNISLEQTEISRTTDVRSEGEASIRLDYAFTFDPAVAHEAILETDLPIAGVPDSLFLDVQSDGRQHRVFYEVEDRFGTPFDLYAAGYANSIDSFASQSGAFELPNEPVMHFPVRLTRLILSLASDQEEGELYTGTLYLDNLRVTYPTKSTDREREPDLPNGMDLHGNYPNPFAASTTITIDVPHADHVRLSVYDLLGREIAVLLDDAAGPGRHTFEFDASDLPSGAYFYHLKTSERVLIGKMMLVR